jgi:hypothetical protein
MLKKTCCEDAESPRISDSLFTKFYTWFDEKSPDNIKDTFEVWLDNHEFKNDANPAALVASMAKKGYIAFAVYKCKHDSEPCCEHKLRISYQVAENGKNPYPCNSGSYFVGVIYASREDICKRYKIKHLRKIYLDFFYECCKEEVEEYSAWVNGDCYCYYLFNNKGTVIDGLGGYFCNTEKNDNTILSSLGVTLDE